MKVTSMSTHKNTERFWVVAFDHDKDVNVWGAVVLDLSGVTSGGATLDEARENVREAIALRLDSDAIAGDLVSEPQGLNAIIARSAEDKNLSEDMAGAIILEVEAGELKPRAVRIQVTMNEALLSRVDRAANAAGTSRSGFLAEGARRMLG